jgi:hypothetical protein
VRFSPAQKVLERLPTGAIVLIGVGFGIFGSAFIGVGLVDLIRDVTLGAVVELMLGALSLYVVRFTGGILRERLKF